MWLQHGALLLAAWAAAAHACSSFTYRCNTTGDVPISGHTFDHGMDLRQSLVTLPAGYEFAGSEPCASCPGQNFTFPHGVAFIAGTGGGYIGAALHGMNDAGLAGGMQTLGDAKGPALRYRPDGPATVLAWPEVLLYLLGTYSTVEEAARDFTPQTHQVITDYASPALKAAVTYLFRSTDMVPVHISLYDASGDGALIEFDGEQGWTVYRNVSAVTNMPKYPEQLENLRRWRAALVNTTRTMSELLQGSYEVVYTQLPGSYSSAARFVRLRELLLQVASLRDLANRMLYWRTPLTARWQGVNVSEAAAADGPRILPLFQGWQDAYEDVSAQLKPIPGLEPGPAEAGAMEQLLPLLSGTATDP